MSNSDYTPPAQNEAVGESAAAKQVSAEQVKLLYASLPLSQAVALVNGAVLGLVQSAVVETTYTVIWFLSLILVTVARTYIGVLYARAPPALRDIRRWRACFLAGAIAAGLVWGSTALLLYPHGAVLHEVFLAFVLGGMVAGAVTLLTPVFHVFVLFALLLLSPITIRYFLVGDAVHYAMAAMGAVFLLAMLAIGKRMHETLRRSLRLQFENIGLISALKTSNEALERRVIERTAALQQQDRRKDEFLATLAHELRNPLAPLASSVEILKLRHDDPNTVARVNAVMERQVRHMMHLIDDLMDVSRISRGKIELHRSPVDLASAIDHAVESCRPALAERTLEIKLPDQPVYIDGDRARLAQVFSNLLNNACKFTPACGHVAVRCEREKGDAVVSVKDDGVGIPPEKLDTVFEMFAQLDTAPERMADGLGLGLSLVKQLVELHGGVVAARSEGRGHGAEFIVRLPLSDAPEVEPPVQTSGASAPRRVLVVDDNRDAAESLAQLLILGGHEAQVACNGRDALDRTRAFEPDMIFLDIGMPGLDGYDTCRALRGEWGDAVGIVALTGWGQEADRRKSEEAGFDAHLVKPVTHETLALLLSTQAKKTTTSSAGKNAPTSVGAAFAALTRSRPHDGDRNRFH